MNKNGKDEYRCTKRQVKETEESVMGFPNVVHDMEYTFADEFYEELKRDYLRDYLEVDISNQEEK